MNLYSLMAERMEFLEKREERKRPHEHNGNFLIRMSELAECPWKAFWNTLGGQPPAEFDVLQSGRVAAGEILENINLKMLLDDSIAETEAWVGRLSPARYGRQHAILIDTHGTDSPTFVYDEEFLLGGRADAILTDNEKNWILFESKTCNEGAERLLMGLWNTEDIGEYLAMQPFALWWMWPYLRQVVGYMHCASVTYKRPVRKAILSILGKGSFIPFRVWIDLDTMPEYEAMLNTLLFQAKLVKEGLEMGHLSPPEKLFKAATRKFCDNCFYQDECRPEYPVIEPEQDVTERMPELGNALQDYYETRGYKKADETAMDKLKERVAVLFDKKPESKQDLAEHQDEFRRVVKFGDSVIKASYSYVEDSTRPLTPEENESGQVITRRGGPRLYVKAVKNSDG